MSIIVKFRKRGETVGEERERLNRVEANVHLPDMTDAGMDRLGADLGLMSTKEATDALTGYHHYEQYRNLGWSHKQIVQSPTFNLNVTWTLEIYQEANLRYNRERYNSAKLPTDIDQ